MPEITLLIGDVREKIDEIPDGTIQLACTSPPYFALRSYLDADHPDKHREIGSEPTVDEYCDNLVDVFVRLRPKMTPSGIYMVNLGDSYSAGGRRGAQPPQTRNKKSRKEAQHRVNDGLADGNQLLVPHRFAMRMQEAGFILRETVTWTKAVSGQKQFGSVMPESVKGTRWERCQVKLGRKKEQKKQATNVGNNFMLGDDYPFDTNPVYGDCPGCSKCEKNDGYVLKTGAWRHTQSFEYCFVFSQGMKYFADQMGVAEASKYAGKRVSLGDKSLSKGSANGMAVAPSGNGAADYIDVSSDRNPRNTLYIGTEPFPGSHFAAWPSSLVAHFIQAFTPDGGVCSACSTPYARIIETEQLTRERPADRTSRHEVGDGVNSCGNTVAGTATKTLGWRACCECDAGPMPATVCDPFCGSCCTNVTAYQMGRNSVGIDLNESTQEHLQKRLAGLRQNKYTVKQVESLEGQQELF